MWLKTSKINFQAKVDLLHIGFPVGIRKQKIHILEGFLKKIIYWRDSLQLRTNFSHVRGDCSNQEVFF